MLSAIYQVLTLLVIILIGAIATRVGYMTLDVRKKMSGLLLNIIAPLYAIKSFQLDYTPDLLRNIIIVAISAFLIIGISLIAGGVIWRKAPDKKRTILHYATAFPNCGYLGYPVVGGLFGDEGVIYVAIFVMIFLVYLWTIGIRIFSGEKEKWYVPLTRPGLIGVIIGLVFFLTSVKLPFFLFQAISMVGSMTSPLAMILIGAFLSEVRIKDLVSDVYIYLTAFIRLVICPAITFFVLKFFGVEGIVFTTIVLISSMPAATNTVLFATKYERNPLFASALVSMTTIMSMASLPIWVYLCSL